MKKIINFMSLVLFVLLFCSIGMFNKAYAINYVTNTSGYKIYYPHTNGTVPITYPDYEPQETEFRGVWVSFFAGDLTGYTSDENLKEQLLDILDTMDYYNLNAIMFHMRTHNDALYPTDLAPRSSYIKGMDFESWDYIEWFINECHKRGIEFHAWLNPYRVSNGTTADSIIAKYKDYTTNPANDINNVLMNKSGEAILDPGIPAVQDYIVDVCMEIIEMYDVDAIHFDDYFYIDGVDDTQTRKKYNTKLLAMDNFRRESVDAFIKKLSDSMYEYNIENGRTVQLGISPSGIYRNVSSYTPVENYKYDSKGNLTSPVGSSSAGYAHYGSPLYCDTKKWIDNEWIDYITPQVYNAMDTDAACYAAVTEWWDGVVKNHKTNLYIGLGLYKKGSESSGGLWYSSENEWFTELSFNQKCPNVKGTCIYQYKSLVKYKDTLAAKKVLSECFKYKTQLPVARRYENQFEETEAKSVSNLKLFKSGDVICLKWDKLENTKDYVVYQYSGDFDANDASKVAGLSGNSNDRDYCLFNIKFDGTKGNMFAVVGLTKSNEPTDVSTISVNDVSEVESDLKLVNFNASYISGVKQCDGKVSVRFYNASINAGTTVSYKVYYCLGLTWDESKKQVIDRDILTTNGLNSVIYQIDKFGYPTVFRIEATTEFGSMYSEDIICAISYNEAKDVFGDIYSFLGIYMDELYD